MIVAILLRKVTSPRRLRPPPPPPLPPPCPPQAPPLPRLSLVRPPIPPSYDHPPSPLPILHPHSPLSSSPSPLLVFSRFFLLLWSEPLLLTCLPTTTQSPQVPSNYNESKFIGYAVSNLALCLLLLLVIWQALSSSFLTAMLAKEVVLLWAISFSVAILLLPKVPPPSFRSLLPTSYLLLPPLAPTHRLPCSVFSFVSRTST